MALAPECEDYLHAADSFDLEAVAYLALGGQDVVQAEQTAWFDEITETKRADIYVEAFVDEQKACGRKPSWFTDIPVKWLAAKLRERSELRRMVNSLLACNRTEDWDPLV